MDMSFQEKSQWLVFVSLLVVFGSYFVQVLPANSVDVAPEHVGLFVAAVVFLVVVQVIGHVALALVERHTDGDERDRFIALKSAHTASFVLAAGVFLSLCVAVLTPGNFVVTHVLLGAWVLAHLVETGSRLIHYRRGA